LSRGGYATTFVDQAGSPPAGSQGRAAPILSSKF
jgi:hypothetical protein